MANVIIVVQDCTLSVPFLPDRAFVEGEEVLPGSRYYLPLIWSGLANDTGIPDPGVTPEEYPELVYTQAGTPVDDAIPVFDESTGLWAGKTLVALGIDPTTLRKRIDSLQFTKQQLALTKTGPVAVAGVDYTAVNMNIAPDASYNQNWNMTGTGTGAVGLMRNVIDVGEGIDLTVSGYQYCWGPWNAMPRSVRFMTDATKVVIASATNAGPANSGFWVYVDGRPIQLAPYTPTVSQSLAFHEITFPAGGTPRLIEWRASAPIFAVYAPKPYEIWKPPPRRGPRVLFMGDSFTSNANVANPMNAAYWNIGPWIGSEDVWLDHIGGTGIGVTSHADGQSNPSGYTVGNRYIDRVNGYASIGSTGVPWDIAAVNPDLVCVHGGGANDRFKGRTNAQVIADATTLFTTLRTKLPKAKLVFMEGFAPPLYFNTFNPDYIAIRQGLQAAMGNELYYIDVATTRPWIRGTGYQGATTGVDNSDIYISTDGVHKNEAGHNYLKRRLAAKIRRIIADEGALAGQLI